MLLSKSFEDRADLTGRSISGRQTPIARQILLRLFDGKLAWTPHKDEGLYEFTGRVKFDAVLNGIGLTQGVVAVRGFEPRSRG
jgi:hypothetical protein